MATATKTADPTITVTGGRNAALLACLAAADAKAELALARKATPKTGVARYQLDRPTALTLVKAALAGAKDAKLSGQSRGAAGKAANAIIQAHNITEEELGLEPAARSPAATGKAKTEGGK